MFPSERLAKVAQATALIAEVVADFTTEIGGTEGLGIFTEAATAGRQLELLQCLSAERVDRSGIWQTSGSGASSTVAFLRNETGETGAWVSRRVRLGRALADAIPETRRVWAEGAIGMEKAAEIATGIDGLDDESTAKADQILAAAAPSVTRRDLRRIADELHSLADPDDAAKKALAGHLRQGVTLSQTFGGYRLTGWLNTELGAILANAIEHFAPKPVAAPDGPTPSPKLRRAIGLAEMARQALTHQQCETAAVAKPTVIVTIPWDVLKFQLGIGDVDGGATLPAAAIRRLACEADILPMTLSGDGQILDAGRTRRTVSAAQRAALHVRDKGCRFNGCQRPPAWCQGHHIREWIRHHGPTDLDNLILLCHYHHHLVHEGGWTITGTATKDLRFHPPAAPPFRPPCNPVRRT